MEEVLIVAVRDYWWVAALGLAPLLVWLGKMGLEASTNQTIAAVYRVALQEARRFEGMGVEWIRSPDGIAFRKEMAEKAYDLLPANVGPVPVGLLKLFVKREVWVAYVEKTFIEVTDLAHELATS